MKYQPPFNLLLSYGECKNSFEWPNYLALGFTLEHVPGLIRMVYEEESDQIESNNLEIWAPVHAWRTLGQLQAVTAIEPLIQFLISNYDDDWVFIEIPIVMQLIGEPALALLTEYLADDSIKIFPRTCFSSAIARIGLSHPGTRTECISLLASQLAQFEKNDPALNGLIISDLLDLNAIESFNTIEAAYQRECVDSSIVGELDEVKEELGISD
jgi:hypothetical protein